MVSHERVNDWAGFSLRISSTRKGSATAFVRKHSFGVGAPVTFDQDDPHVSAIEYVLGAFGADLVNGLVAAARARHLTIDAAEALVKAELDDPLAAVGVIGATGHAGLARIEARVYASSGEDEETLQGLWNQTLARSPLVRTFERAVELKLQLFITP